MLLTSPLSAGQQTVIYPRPESQGDVRANYPVAVLQLCEKKSNQAFLLKPSKVSSQQGRSIRQLIKGIDMDIIWALTTEERENALLPIRIPIDRGLLGWRMLLIRKADSDLFQTVTSREQLAALLAGQGHDWPDADVLRANQFRVATSSTYEGLFLMLARGHIQYLPRSISEIWPELNSHSDLNLQVQTHLMIHYPAAFYFFVNKNNTQLASILTGCLQTASQDGSLRALFNQYFRNAIVEADFAHKTIIALDNPQLPEATPLTTREYWFSPEEMLQNE
ncbi:MAG TPA: hypothetical protein VN030_11405 [Cellvibrio sp.]|nr:hypothetical protein [Cellvibrio sp.]